MRKSLLAFCIAAMLLGCEYGPFLLEPPSYKNLVHRESGLYVHREVELRVNAARLETPPTDAAPDAVPELDTDHFFPLGVRSSNFISSAYEPQGDDLVWREVEHLSDDDLKGKTSLGACIRWEKDGAVTIKDVLEIFQFPPPDAGRLDQWSPWVKASSRRGGVFAWHAEANKQTAETPAEPPYPFQMRFRLVLSRRMYP